MKIILVISFILIGIQIARFTIGGILGLFTNKYLKLEGNNNALKMRIVNFFETLLLVAAYTFIIYYCINY